MRIALINYEYPPIGAGAATATQSIARALVGLGHEPIVFTSAFGGRRGIVEEDGFKVVCLPALRRQADAGTVLEMAAFMFVSSLSIPLSMRSWGVDAIIVFFTIPSGPSAWISSLLGGPPYIVSLRGGDVPGLVPSLDRVHALLRPLRRAILRRGIAVVANAPGLRELSMAADPLPVRVIPNGVDTRFFTPPEHREIDPCAPFKILLSGRLHPQKNHAFSLRCFAEFARSSSRQAELHILGNGGLRASLEQLAGDLGIASSVVWHDWLPREGVAQLLRECDCLMHPSLYEGMPNSVLEGMAAGLPVIASIIPGNVDVVRDGSTGWLLPLGDPAPYVERLKRLASNPGLGREMGARGRQVVETDFSWETTAKAYVDLFVRSGVSRGGAGAH